MKAFNIIKNIILDIIIVILIIFIIIGFINKKKPVPIFNYYFFTVMTGSMQDALYPGNSIIVKKVNDYSVGDIITYKQDDIYVTHRIVKIDGNKVVTKGDANKDNDPEISKDDILGKLVYHSEILDFIVKNRFFIILGVIVLYLLELILKPEKKVGVKSNEEIN